MDDDLTGRSAEELAELERLTDLKIRIIAARSGVPVASQALTEERYRPGTPDWAKSLDAWLGSRQPARTISRKMMTIAVVLAIVVSLPTLVPACVSFYEKFEEARHQLTPSGEP